MVIDAIVDGYFPILEHYGDALERFEIQILEGCGRDVLGDLYSTKRDLSGVRRATWPLRDALNQLMRDEVTLSASARLHLRDTLDHTMEVVELNETYRELGTSLIDVHLSMVGQRTNEVMRVLTVVTAVFIPLSFFAAVYGMNFDVMPELRWRFGYLAFWLISLVVGVTLLLMFRQLGWLRRPRGRRVRTAEVRSHSLIVERRSPPPHGH
jgi:magnesium transporter